MSDTPFNGSWLENLVQARPALGGLVAGVRGDARFGDAADALAHAVCVIADSLERGGTLFLCGNGGSLSDALHVSGELLKSFVRPRPLAAALRQRLIAEPNGEELAAHLQAGLRAHVLGVNAALSSAVANDIPVPGIGYAQELCALARSGDVLMGISTSGRASNVLLATSVARAMGLTTIGLTGAQGVPLADRVHIAIRVPATETYRVQELHLALYHQLCLMLEACFF